MTGLWIPPTRRPVDHKTLMRPGPIRILDAKGRLKKIIPPDLRGLPCWHHKVRGCPDCSARINIVEGRE